MIRVSEIFHSVQGEGRLTGIPSVFIRTSGCNLRCWFCDTPYASWEPEGDHFAVHQIVEQVLRWSTPHVVITGGEPLLFREIEDLTRQLRDTGRHVTIETAGTLDSDAECDLWSISPKLSNSNPVGFATEKWTKNHEARRNRPDIVQRLIGRSDYQLKFVVGSILDAEEACEYLDLLKGWDRSKVMLMPRGVNEEELKLQTSWLANWCREHGFRLCDRQHIYWFGNRRGT